jgi:hypothetical protein
MFLHRLQSAATLILVYTVVAGCSHFVVRDDDNPAEVTGKVFGRLLCGVATVGWSEVGMKIHVHALSDEFFLEGYREQLSNMVSDNKISKAQAEWLYRQESTYLANAVDAHRSRVAAAASAASYQMQMNRPTSCTSTASGRTVYTNCY